MEGLLELDRKAFLAINGLHTSFGDVVMSIVSMRWVWIPFYALLLALLLWRLGWWQTLKIVVVVVLLILISDQLASTLLKPLVHRLRPCHAPDLEGMVHLVNHHCGGQYGFASSHAANFFALATFLAWHFRTWTRWVPISFFLVAGLVSFSRVYLGVHYPGDVLAGMLIGLLVGGLGIILFQSIIQKINFPQPKAQ